MKILNIAFCDDELILLYDVYGNRGNWNKDVVYRNNWTIKKIAGLRRYNAIGYASSLALYKKTLKDLRKPSESNTKSTLLEKYSSKVYCFSEWV